MTRPTSTGIWTPSQLERRARVEAGETVVAHITKDRALIEWADERGKFARIDRKTEWGNPFVIPRDGERPTVIEKFAAHLEVMPDLRSRVGSLRGKVLGCWCHPAACHGEVLIRCIAEESQP